MSEKINNRSSKLIGISLILNVITLAGLGLLFYHYFADKNNTGLEPQTMELSEAGNRSGSVVFVNSDLLLTEYELVKKLTAKLEKDRKKKDEHFTSRQKAYESDAAYFQQQVEKQAISEQSAQQIYEQLMQQQQDLYELQNKYTNELAQGEFEINVVLLDSVRNYLSRLNENNNYDYIFSYNSAGNILLANDTFNITNKVIRGLNKEYNEKYEVEE